MSAPRPGTPGATRTCPHCKATILESASVCPACRHHLRFEASAGTDARRETALLVEGRIGAGTAGEALEYTMTVVIRNERGEEVARHVVGVGALEGTQSRSFSVAVETTARPGARSRRQ
jgi:hypothetical protein